MTLVLVLWSLMPAFGPACSGMVSEHLLHACYCSGLPYESTTRSSEGDKDRVLFFRTGGHGRACREVGTEQRPSGHREGGAGRPGRGKSKGGACLDLWER